MPEFSKTFTALEVLSPSSHTHIIFYFQLCVFIVWACALVAWRGWRKALEPLELELRAVSHDPPDKGARKQSQVQYEVLPRLTSAAP